MVVKLVFLGFFLHAIFLATEAVFGPSLITASTSTVTPGASGIMFASKWSLCSSACGSGYMTRTWMCINATSTNHFYNISESDFEEKCNVISDVVNHTLANSTSCIPGECIIETQICSNASCPGVMVSSREWSQCSIPCGDGYRSLKWVCLKQNTTRLNITTEDVNSYECNRMTANYSELQEETACAIGDCYIQKKYCYITTCPDFFHVGCWKDHHKFGLQSLEPPSGYKMFSDLIIGKAVKREHAILRCALATENLTNPMFALFDNGQCWSGSGFETFWRRGLAVSTLCGKNGRGSKYYGDVYFMASYLAAGMGGFTQAVPYYTPWVEWDSCTVACDGGSHSRSYSCVTPENFQCEEVLNLPYNMSKDETLQKYYEEKSCHTESCPWNVSVQEPYKWIGCWYLGENWTQSLEFDNVSVLDGFSPKERHAPIDKCAVASYRNNSRFFALSENECFITANTFVKSIAFNHSDPAWPSSCEYTGLADGAFDLYEFNLTEPVDGQWSPWTGLQSCTRACDGGVKERFRYCINPPPENSNASYCVGHNVENETCNMDPCPDSFNYTHIGCYQPVPFWPSGSNQENNFNEQFDKPQKYRPRLAKVEKCALKASNLGFKMFALLNDGKCYSHTDMHCTELAGIKEICSEEGLGDDTNYDVYLLGHEYVVNETLEELRQGCIPETTARMTTMLDGGWMDKWFKAISQMSLREEESADILREIINLTAVSSNTSSAFTISGVLDILQEIALKTRVYEDGSYNEYEKAFIQAMDQLLHERYNEKWELEKLNATLSDVLRVIELFSTSLISNNSRNYSLEITTSNLDFKVASVFEFFGPRNISNGWFVKTTLTGPFEETVKEPTDTNLHDNNLAAITTFPNLLERFPLTVNSNLGNAKAFTTTTGAVRTVSVSVTLHNDVENNLKEDVIENIFKHNLVDIETSNQKLKPVCVFWDFSIISEFGGAWSSSGCRNTLSTDEILKCGCNHLTSFAVLMQLSDEVKENPVLSFITNLFSGISIFLLLVSLVMLTYLDTLRSEKSSIHKNLILSLLCAQSIFVAGVQQTWNKALCGVIAGLLHFFYLSSFGWMLCEGIHLYFIIVQVFNHGKKTLYYYTIGWALPLVIVIISAASRYDGYGTTQLCWLSTENGLIWAFLAPVAFIILVNAVIGTSIVFIVVRSSTAMPTHDKEGNEKTQQLKAGLRSILVLLPILGTTWFLGFLANLRYTEFFDYLFVAANCLQGTFVFLFHCLGNSEVRSAMKLKWNQRKLKNKVGVSEQSSSRHVFSKSSEPRSSSVVLSMGSMTASTRTENDINSLYNDYAPTPVPDLTEQRGRLSSSSTPLVTSTDDTDFPHRKSTARSTALGSFKSDGCKRNKSNDPVFTNPKLFVKKSGR